MYLCSSLFRFCDKNKSNEKGRIPSEEADLNFRDAKKFYRTPIIYNKATGEFADVAETVKYAQTLGSLKAPLALTVPEVTGISSVVAADKVQTEGIYDMNGRRINSMTQSGVYVVKTMEGGKIVTKKVVVK